MRNLSLGAVALAAALAVACTTVSKNGLYKEFRSLGFSAEESECLVRELDGVLDDRKMAKLLDQARFESNGGERTAFFRLMRSKDENIKRAVASAGRRCIARTHM